MSKSIERLVAQYAREFKDHRLELVQEGRITGYYLRSPKLGRMQSCLILFTPEGIALVGDLVPECKTGGCVSGLGYGLVWFSGHLSSSYLCEKFLRREWVMEHAVENLIDYRNNVMNYGVRRAVKLRQIARQLSGSDYGTEWLYEQLIDAGYDTSDGLPGVGYPIRDAALLIAIQRKFAELYWLDIEAKRAAIAEANAS